MSNIPFEHVGHVEVKSLTTLNDGDLLIRGIGANFLVDREDEAFTENAFSRGLAKFLAGPSPLNYHHRAEVNLGRVTHACVVEGKGVELEAIVRHQPIGSPYRHLYESVKNGDIASLSVGGVFRRIMTPAGPRIDDVDICEWSITPLSIGRGTNFDVIAGKAVSMPEEDNDADVKALRERVERLSTQLSGRKSMPVGIAVQPPAPVAKPQPFDVPDPLANDAEKMRTSMAWKEERIRRMAERLKQKREAEERGEELFWQVDIPYHPPVGFGKDPEGSATYHAAPEVEPAGMAIPASPDRDFLGRPVKASVVENLSPNQFFAKQDRESEQKNYFKNINDRLAKALAAREN